MVREKGAYARVVPPVVLVVATGRGAGRGTSRDRGRGAATGLLVYRADEQRERVTTGGEALVLVVHHAVMVAVREREEGIEGLGSRRPRRVSDCTLVLVRRSAERQRSVHARGEGRVQVVPAVVVAGRGRGDRRGWMGKDASPGQDASPGRVARRVVHGAARQRKGTTTMGQALVLGIPA